MAQIEIGSEMGLRILGVIAIVAGLSGLFGFWKRWYWRSKKSSVYGFPLLGLVTILVSFEDAIMQYLHVPEWVLIFLYIILLSAVVWLSASPPEFLKPKFVKRIEQESPNVYDKMVQHVMQDKPWRDKINTSKSLEKWIAEVKRKK